MGRGGTELREAGASRDEEVRRAAAEHAPKHRRVIREAKHGRRLSASMLPFVLALPPAGFGVITTTGRKTGKRRRKCIRFARRGDRVYLVQLRPPELAMQRPGAVAAWVWNLRANPSVTLRMRGGTFAGTAREIEDPAELAEAREALTDPVYPTDYAECSLHLRGRPTRAKIQDLHRYWFDTGIPLAIDLR